MKTTVKQQTYDLPEDFYHCDFVACRKKIANDYDVDYKLQQITAEAYWKRISSDYLGMPTEFALIRKTDGFWQIAFNPIPDAEYLIIGQYLVPKQF